ncbi:MAG: type II toxin-antitoxin system VapC family toxin [Chitinophagales bacterium]
MNYLLDTHACIWALADQHKLSPKVRRILKDSENIFWVSKISLFEIAIKMKIGKLPDFRISFPEFVQSVYLSGYEMLPVRDEHLETYHMIDFEESHRDPFDRYLLAAAHFEKLAIITKDEKFKFYNKAFIIVW